MDGIRGELKGWGRRIDGMPWRRIYGMRGQIGGKKKPYDRGNVLIIRLLCGFRDVICRQNGWNKALFLNLLP